MAGQQLSCPGCGTAMEEVAEADVHYDRCPSCQGLFLDSGELNVLATELAGDIEFCSVERGQEYPDVFPPRQCPRCPDHRMKKEDLLIYTGLILDFCESCGGWFLDAGELEKMNRSLSELRASEGGDADYRATHREHLVTVTVDTEVVSQAVFLQSATAVATSWRHVEIYFKAPLGVGLRISSETRGAWFWRLFGSHDLEFGDEAFDRAFLVKADDEAKAKDRLGKTARGALLEFHQSDLAKLGRKQTFQVLDDRLRYSYSAWGHPEDEPSEPEVKALIEALVGVAEAIET